MTDIARESGSFGKHSRQLVRDAQWFNSGPPSELVREHFLTPRELFFTRNHAALPNIDPGKYGLRVEGLSERPLELSLSELRNGFPIHSVAATLICAGLRRAELNAVHPIPNEVPWGTEPVSTGMWRGVRLRDVLAAAGMGTGAGHVSFMGLDEVERHGERFGFGASIPLEKAVGPEVLLALDLNGEPLSPVHGFPVRVVVPGYIGARSVKWLSTITVQAEPSTNYFQARAYRVFPPEVGPETVRWEDGVPLSDIPLNAVIWEPGEGALLPSGSTRIRGWALAGRGRRIDRVEVSTDEGASWTRARLPANRDPWTWCFWETRVFLAAGTRTLTVRAWDSAGETQPARPLEVWNFKGYANNAWHRISVTVASPGTRAEDVRHIGPLSSPTEPWK
jgi:sulfite oxidase